MTKQWHGGKGSQRRNSNDKAYADNYDRIFGKVDQKTKQKQVTELNGDGDIDESNSQIQSSREQR